MKNLPVFLAEVKGLTSKEQPVQRSAPRDLRQGFGCKGRGQSGSTGSQSLLEYPSGLPDEGEELRPGPEDLGVHFLWNLGVKDLF